MRQEPAHHLDWWEQPFRSIDVDYPQLLKQIAWDTFFACRPEPFLLLGGGVPVDAFGPLGSNKPRRFRPSTDSFARMSALKQLLEAYESELRDHKPMGDAKEVHHDLEFCVRAAILGVGKVRNGDLKGAMGYWNRSADYWHVTREKLQELQEQGSLLALFIDAEWILATQTEFGYPGRSLWPPCLD